MKLVYIGFSFMHHKNNQAGYHHIKDYLKYDTIIDCQREFEFVNSSRQNFFFRAFRKLYKLMLGEGCPLAVLHCILLSIFRKNQIFHFVYGENTYKWLHHFKGKTNKIVCTFHQPSDFFSSHNKLMSSLKELDAIILMTKKDICFFERATSKSNVYFIPHGINTQFYSSMQGVGRENMILMCGNWLRNFEFANLVFQKLLKMDEKLKISIVSNSTNFSYFDAHDRIYFYSGISDNELCELYHRAKILFLALESYTANNAILEAAAANCPILIATNNIDESYFSTDQVRILPLDLDEVVKCLYFTSITSNSELKDHVVNRYSWDVVAKKTIQLFDTI